MDSLDAGRQYQATLDAARRLRFEAAGALLKARELEDASDEGRRAQIEIAVLEAAA